MDLESLRDAGKLIIEQVDAAELSPGEFTARVRRCVGNSDARTVILDSLNGYQAAMPQEQYLLLHVHELLQFLNRQGANTFLTVAQHGLVGEMKSPVDVTYLADTVLLLRYFEAMGRMSESDAISSERALILAPYGRDALVAAQILTESGVASEVCADLHAIHRGCEAGAGLALIVEEVLRDENYGPLARWIETQPPWSDFPVIVLAQRGALATEMDPAKAEEERRLAERELADLSSHDPEFAIVEARLEESIAIINIHRTP
jgi:hypothetical protein